MLIFCDFNYFDNSQQIDTGVVGGSHRCECGTEVNFH